MSTHTKTDAAPNQADARVSALRSTQIGPKTYSNPVLCVDLDGTLIKSDLLWESILVLLKAKPHLLLLAPYWLLAGRANLKRQLARHANLRAASLPYRSDVVEFVRAEHAAGRQIVLATAADRELANGVAEHLKVFTQVCASDGETNLKGKAKARRLAELFREQGFEYVGNSPADLEVWRAAAGGYVVGDEGLAHRASTVTSVRQVFPTGPGSAKTWVHALRGHHWFKNLLLFLPLALAHKLNFGEWLVTALGFFLFGMCASGLYILNDLLDLHSDRGHPWKHKRPFAAGDIPIPQGLAIAFLFLGCSLTGAFLMNARFGIVLCGYVVLTLWYSLSIKKIVLLDVFVLSSFYTVRLIAGALLTAIPLSHWFLVFSLFFFLSLAMAKRYSELVHAEDLVKSGQSGRGYIGNDRELLLVLGVGSSFSAVVILSLYVHSQEVGLLYRKPGPLLLLCPIILYWLSHIWLKAHRGDLHEDPVTFAIREPVSYAVGAAVALAIAASMLGIGL
jgi:4-hydroxybenzoate polyprenyltransferase/phosphoserine phosphatase